MKTLFASSVALSIATVSSAQNLPNIQESGDILGDCVRLNNPNSTSTVSSPFNMGFVQAPTSNLISATFTNYNSGSASSPNYVTDVYLGYKYDQEEVLNSGICLNFTPYPGVLSAGFQSSPNSVTMYAADVIPCIETKLPKGTYTFQATATPNVNTSTPGTFEFETETSGAWTVQFNLALPKPEGATRTLTFAHDTRVRWMLISSAGQKACAAITAKYYNSGS